MSVGWDRDKGVNKVRFGNRQTALVLGTSMLSLALLGGAAAAAFQPVGAQTSAHPERVEKAKPPLPKLEEILDRLVVDGKITATQREAILAAVKHATDKTEEKRPASSWKGHLEGYLKTAATFLGLTEKDVLAALREGKSLAELAVAHGKTREALIAAISAPANAKVAEALAANTMTAEQATKAKAEIAERAAKLVDAKHDPKIDKDKEKDKHKDKEKDKDEKDGKEHDRKRVDVHSLIGNAKRSALAYLGITEKALQEQLRAGKSLAEIAVASGKTRDGLAQEVAAPGLAKIDELKTSGKLTDEQAAKAKAQLAEAVIKIVDAKTKVKAKVTLGRDNR